MMPASGPHEGAGGAKMPFEVEGSGSKVPNDRSAKRFAGKDPDGPGLRRLSRAIPW